MRSSRLGAVVPVLIAALSITGCSRSDHNTAPQAFCTAARKLDDRLSKGARLDEQIRLVRKLVETAPKKIEADARTFLDALERVKSDPSVKDSPRVKRAVEGVNRYAAQGCGFYKRQPGGGI